MHPTIRIAATTLLGTLLLGGCAGRHPQVIVDKAGVDPVKYERDLAECQGYAEEVAAGRQVARGAAGSAVVGGAVGSIADNSHSSGEWAAAGAVVGAARGAREVQAEKQAVVRTCLTNRGYKVLN